MASVDNVIVQNQLRTSSQSGGTLHLKGTGSRQPAVEKALVVQGGASFAGVVTVGTLDVGANATVYGEVIADGGFGNVTTPAVTLNGILTCPAVSTSVFAQQYFIAPGGSNVTGNGTVANPYATIGAGIAAAYAAELTSVCIVLTAGTYTEDVSIDSSIATDITIVGSGPDQVTVQGNIAIAVSSESALSVPGTVSFIGLAIAGKLWDFSQLIERKLVVENCSVTSTALDNAGPSVLFLSGHLWMSNSVVTCTGNGENPFNDSAMICLAIDATVKNSHFVFSVTDGTSEGVATSVILQNGSVSSCTFDLLLANDNLKEAYVCVFAGFEGPTDTVILQDSFLNLTIESQDLPPNDSITGVYNSAASASYFIRNTFNVKGTAPSAPVVYNDNSFGSTYSQGNVALPGSLTGFSTPPTVLATI